MLRKEIHRMREQCHEKSMLHSHYIPTEVENMSNVDVTQSGDLESIEVCIL